MTTDSQQLLSEYANTGSEAAFRELVARYVDLVHSTAIRLLEGDGHRAQDVTQTVFLDLARQACKLSSRTTLGGWLHRDTCFVAAKMMRGERRRRSWERQAAEMNALNNSDDRLGQMAPFLDEAINALKEEDRMAILLRFYERRDLRSVGEALGSIENAAQKRAARALEQLHALLTRRGIALSAAALGTALAGEAVAAAPAGLAGNIAGAALAGAATASGALVTMAKVMSITQLKFTVVSALVAAAVVAPWAVQHQALNRLRDESSSLRRKLDAEAGLQEENQRLSNLAAHPDKQQNVAGGQLRELMKLRGEVGRLRQENQEIERLRQENGRLRVAQVRPAPSSETGLSTGSSGSPPLYFRTIMVNPDTVVSKVKVYTKPTDADTDPAPLRKAALQQLLLDNGIEIEPHGAVSLDENEGKVNAYTSLQNIDKLERLIKSWGDQDRTASQGDANGSHLGGPADK
ncbi:MAG: RNA polymerase sigma factor [Limisphaerales bacterium]